MENQTCRSFYTSLSPVPPDPRLLLTSFPNLPKYLAPCWFNPSSDCENRNVILSRFETMVILSSILKKCQKSTSFENCEISTIIDLFLLCFVVSACMPGRSDWARASNTKVGQHLADENNYY
eukprot:TRINITY_DN274_c0_g1_i6.p1 TRINITY_DN274_c0_g1~~TRINITY_DN274_c0_g1_i6.p1  ORF type:complete len:122 (+),score=2.39 TRINITY_DN274_c0_g1_i6:268-633(+)